MPRIQVALGVSPENALLYDDNLEEAIRQAAKSRYVRAIGSCGLRAPQLFAAHGDAGAGKESQPSERNDAECAGQPPQPAACDDAAGAGDAARADGATGADGAAYADGAAGASGAERVIVSIDDQLKAFGRQIYLAQELKLPLVVEACGAQAETLTVLKAYEVEPHRVMLRAFDGTPEELQAWAEWGCFVSFDGRVANDVQAYCELARIVPGERTLVESGAPGVSLDMLTGQAPRADQVVFVADALQGFRSPTRLAMNYELLFNDL